MKASENIVHLTATSMDAVYDAANKIRRGALVAKSVRVHPMSEPSLLTILKTHGFNPVYDISRSCFNLLGIPIIRDNFQPPETYRFEYDIDDLVRLVTEVRWRSERLEQWTM